MSSASAEDEAPAISRQSLRWRGLKLLLRVALLAGVVFLVWNEVSRIDIHETRARLADADLTLILLSLAAALAAVAVMGIYDVVAFPDTPRMKRPARWAHGMLIFAWTNFLTLGPIGGPAIRLYIYRRRGLDTRQIVRGLGRMYAGMFGGLSAWLIAAILPLGQGPMPLTARVLIAAALAPSLAIMAGYIVQRLRPSATAYRRKRPLAILGLIGMTDWFLAFTAFVLTGRALGIDIPLTEQVRTVFVGHAVGMISMMPGGLGSADAVWLKMQAAAGVDENIVAAQIFLFRTIFYMLPWAASLLGLYMIFAGRTETLLWWQRRVLAGGIGLNALWLLGSTATPAFRERLRLLNRLVPVDAVEVSHAVAVVAAVMMLFLIRGILRGYRSAFLITGSLLAMSIVAHPFKGGDFEEAGASLAMLTLLAGAHRAFKRRGRVPIGWELTLAVALGSLAFFVIVGVTAFAEWPLREGLLGRMGTRGDPSRFVRGLALVGLVGLAFLVRQAVLPKRHHEVPSEDQIDRAVRFIAAHADSADAMNIAAGDKGAWFWRPDGDPDSPEQGLVVFQRRYGKMVVFSDPIVDQRRISDLLEDLHEFAVDQDVELVFYQTSGRLMQHLHDFGYTFFKLGEEAIVHLAEFSLTGGQAHQFRKTLRRVEAEGVTFQVLFPPFAPEVIEEARQISDDWLEHKGIQEMQFSLGYFSPGYLQRFPLAVARNAQGEMIAFMNILAVRPAPPGKRAMAASSAAPPQHQHPSGEVTFDLMRYRPGVDALMDLMILRCLEWAKAQGYATVNLGMSPLFDVGEYRRASLPERLAKLLFEHGERIYNYRGLHAFKDKFRPRWEPRYMAYQRPWDWPAAVFTATSLIWARTPSDRKRITAARDGDR